MTDSPVILRIPFERLEVIMKRRLLLVWAVVTLCGILGGCGFWMNGDYLSVTPNEPQIDISGDEVKEVADHIICTNDEHAIAYLINELIPKL